MTLHPPTIDQATIPTIRVFGGMSVQVGGEPVSIGGARQRRLLALLVARSGTTASLDWLAEHLWTDDERPADMTAPLRTYVHRLRRSLPPHARDWIETESSGYRLTAPEGSIDHEQAQSLRAQATRARELDDPSTALELLNQAVALWRRDPFRELEDFDWARAMIEQLEVDRLELFEERWEVSLALGRHTQITGELAAFTSEHGTRDRAVRQHALALHRSGRTAEALRVIDALRTRLAEESGLEPSLAVLELEAAMLVGDESLVIKNSGRPLRGYRLLEEIGNGAFAVVWRAEQPSVGRDVAIKQIRSELATQPEFVRRFEAEAHLVASIEHPHIVPLIDYWRDPDSAYLVLRWLRGGTLERRLDDGPLSASETMRVARQIGSALASAHAQGVVHRDVKPANILFDHEGNAFLSDFGIALEIAASNGPEAALSPGSPAYASPEQERREQLGPEADVYSLGVVISECLDRAEKTPTIAAALERATAPDRAERYSSIDEFLAGFAGETLPSPVLAINPYKGLRAFDQSDNAVFFGRERLVAELTTRLSATSIESRCVVLVGPSGSGKSSVLRAGLTPALRRGAVAGSDDWFISTMVPGNDPFEALEAALLRVAVNPPASLIEQLRDGPRGIVRGMRRSLGTQETKLFLAIDQFEELFIGTAAELADDFLDALAVAVHDPTSPLRLALTIRADFYGHPLAHANFAPIVKACAVELTPLAGDELERAIIEPARHAGIEFEPTLVSRIAAATVGQPAPLPLMQYALSELFDRRDGATLTVAAYDEMGGITGALAARAESIYANSMEDHRAAIRRFFGRLTDPTGNSSDLRRRIPTADLHGDPIARWVLDEYGEARLLTFDRDNRSREPTVEVAHEALLREWPRLVSWLDEDRDLLRSIAAVSVAASEWERSGRAASDLYRGWRLDNALELTREVPERLRKLDREFVAASNTEAESDRQNETKRLRRLHRLVGAIGVALLGALIAGGLAVRQSNRADDEAERALAAAAEAELATLVSRSAEQVGANPDLGVLLALEAYRRAPAAATQQAVLNALGSSSIGNRVATFEPLGDGDCSQTTITTDGRTEFGVSAGRLVSRSTLTGDVVDHGPSPEPCLRWIGDIDRNQRAAVSSTGRTIWLGPLSGPWDVEIAPDRPVLLESRSLTPTDRLLLRTQGARRTDILLLDGTTGESVAEVHGQAEEFAASTSSADGSLLAFSYSWRSSATALGITLIVDGATGAELNRIHTAEPLYALAIDPVAGELVGASGTSATILTFDLETGAKLAEVRATSTANLTADGLMIRPDGLLVVATRSQIEVLDRRAGPIDTPIPLQGASIARARHDGAIVTLLGDDRLSIIEPTGSAIIERSWPIAPFSEVHLHDGTAVVTTMPGAHEVIDLATGTRTSMALKTIEGQPHAAPAAFPRGEGIWTISAAGFTYWEEQAQQARVMLDGAPTTINALENRVATLVSSRTGYEQVQLVDLDRLRVVLSIPAPFAATGQPIADDGLHVLFRDGRLHTYDAEGRLTGEMYVEARDATLYEVPVARPLGTPISLDPSTGRLALTGLGGEALIVDPALGQVEALPVTEDVISIAFTRDGTLLVVGSASGTVSLWDLTRGQSAGRVFSGAGTASLGVPWYDAASDSVWIAASARLLQIPLDPDRWIDRACDVVGREFTQEEWDRFVPGTGLRQPVCT